MLPVNQSNQAIEIVKDNGKAIIVFLSNEDNVKELLSHYSKNTFRQYIATSKPFIAFIQKNGFGITTLEQFRKTLDAYQNKSSDSKRAYLNSAKIILKRFNKFYPNLLPDFIYIRMITDVKPIPSSEKHKNGINNDEVQLIKDYINEIEDGYQRTRLTAMFVLMTFQGLRQFEVAKIKVEDLNLNSKFYTVTGKGGATKERRLFKSTIEELDKYFRFWNIQSGYLFTSQSRNKKTGNHLTARSVRRFFKDILVSVGIDEKKSTHGLRHYYMTSIAKKFKDPYKVKEFGRLNTLETSVKYVDDVVNEGDVKELESVFEF